MRLTIVEQSGAMWRSGRRAGCCGAGCRTRGRPARRPRRVADDVNLFLLFFRWLGTFRPRIRLPLFGHEAARHAAIARHV